MSGEEEYEQMFGDLVALMFRHVRPSTDWEEILNEETDKSFLEATDHDNETVVRRILLFPPWVLF